MQFWKNDRRDEGFEMPVSEVADLYVKSKYADSEAYDWPLTRSVAAFLEDSDGPIAAAFDPNSAAFDELIHEVYVREFTRECHSDGEVSVTVGQPPMGHYVREGYFENDPEHRMWAKDECQLWFPEVEK